MGGELLKVGSSLIPFFDRVGDGKDNPTLSYTQIIWECLPQYMAMGMSNDEFWNCDPRLYKAYRDKVKISAEYDNSKLWMQGAYFYNALASALSRLNPKNHPIDYPSQPYTIGSEEEIQEKKISDGYASMMNWATKVNRHKKGQKNES